MVTKDFVLAGHAIFTVSNPAGEYYTYRVTAPADQNEIDPLWFVSALTGPDNLHDYSYLGVLKADGTAFTTAKSKFPKDSKPVLVVKWALKCVWEGGELPAGYKIDHIGRCGRCGLPLTTPDSIQRGLGPVCAGKE